MLRAIGSRHQAALCRRSRETGFSLLEVLLASVILATGVLVVSQGFSLGVRSAAVGRQYTEGVLLAQSRLAELMLEDDLDVVDSEGDFETSSLQGARWTFATEDTETTGVVRVTVTVRGGGDWGERQVTLSALRPEFDLLSVSSESSGAAGGSE